MLVNNSTLFTILTLTLTLTLLTLTSTTANFNIITSQRTINLGGFSANEQIKLSFMSLQDNQQYFLYAMLTKYDNLVYKISFRKQPKEQKTTLPFTKSIYLHDGISITLYKIVLDQTYHTNDSGDLFIFISFLNRFINLPASITMNQDQKLQYHDQKYLLSPYNIVNQQSTFKFHKIIQHDSDGEKKGTGSVVFRTNQNKPYTLVETILFGVNHNPLVQFQQVEKVIEVSLWGSMAVTEKYKIKNVGPRLKGEFSRVTFGSRNPGQTRTAFKGIDFELPYDIYGLYYRDQVGNISTSRAYRDHNSRTVRVGLQPRFGLLGSWKSNWQIGYNFPTDRYMLSDGLSYQLNNLKVPFAIDRVQTESYTIKIILPQNVYQVSIAVDNQPIDLNNIVLQTTTGYLDFTGRPTYILHNHQSLIHGQKIQVNYKLNRFALFKKPIMVVTVLFLLLLMLIVIKRVKLDAFEQKSKSD